MYAAGLCGYGRAFKSTGDAYARAVGTVGALSLGKETGVVGGCNMDPVATGDLMREPTPARICG